MDAPTPDPTPSTDSNANQTPSVPPIKAKVTKEQVDKMVDNLANLDISMLQALSERQTEAMRQEGQNNLTTLTNAFTALARSMDRMHSRMGTLEKSNEKLTEKVALLLLKK